MSTKPSSLTVILPVFNGAGWIGQCLEHVDAAIANATFAPCEIVVVDDGSTDATAEEVEALRLKTPLRLVRQANAGRFLARRRGLDESTGELVLFIDTRVFLGAGSLAFISPLVGTADARVWTADVQISTVGNSLGRFWRAIEHVAWRRYWRRPRRLSFGLEDFDYYPKGTTALVCPRDLIVDAYNEFSPTVSDMTKINDDTALLRHVAARTPINIAPEYMCTYHARSTLRSFLRHANHRGSVLIDGYLRPGTRFAVPIALVLAATPVAAVVAVLHPIELLIAAVVAALVAGLLAAALGAMPADAAVLSALSIPFGLSYLAGLWKGFFLRVEHWRGRTAEEPGAVT